MIGVKPINSTPPFGYETGTEERLMALLSPTHYQGESS